MLLRVQACGGGRGGRGGGYLGKGSQEVGGLRVPEPEI